MGRKEAFQFTNQPWFPSTLRLLSDEFLDFMVTLPRANRPFLPLFDELLAHSKARALVAFDGQDGGGLVHIASEVGGPRNGELSVILTDEQWSPARVKREEALAARPVEVLTCSAREAAERFQGKGIGVYINSFHRLGRGADRAALANLVDRNLDVFVGEGNNNSLWQVVGMTVFVPTLMFLLTPFVKPFRLSRLLFTYLLPVMPFVTVWDGLAALLRLHRPEELEALAKSMGRTDYVWRAGKRQNGRGGYVIYLLGYRGA
jgi:hypothetical protein